MRRRFDVRLTSSGGSRGGAPLFWVKKEEMTELKWPPDRQTDRHVLFGVLYNKWYIDHNF